MDIYHYHPETHEFLGRGTADRDPMDESNWLIPAWTTQMAPPAEQPGKSIHLEGGAWIYRDIEVSTAPADLPSFGELRASEISKYIDTREKMCARVAGIGQHLARAGDTAGALSCDAVVNALLDVLAHPTVTGAADIESLRIALKTRYLAAVGLATDSAKTEFKRYDK
jgi:hypothetical protein